jgi:hypothetical protein
MTTGRRPAWARERIPAGQPLRALGDERVLLGAYAISTVVFGVVTTMTPHDRWSLLAAVGYTLSLAVATVAPNRGLGAALAVLTTVVLPVLVLSWSNLAQPEVGVVVAGARSWIETGSPYLAKPESLDEFRPYLPASFLAGLAEAFSSVRLTDPRVIALAGLAGCCWAATGLARHPVRGDDPRARPLPPLTHTTKNLCLTLSCPIAALAIAASFIDVPQAALTLLAVAAVTRRRMTLGGVAVGITLMMKPTALIAFFVLVLFAHAIGKDMRSPLRVAGSALVAAAVLVAGPLWADPGRIWRDVILFPLGLTNAPKPPAETPFLGVLLRQAGVPTSALLVLIALVGTVYAVYCIRVIDRSPTRAAYLLSLGFALAFFLAPYSRAGYLIVPVVVGFGTRAIFGPIAARSEATNSDPE